MCVFAGMLCACTLPPLLDTYPAPIGIRQLKQSG